MEKIEKIGILLIVNVTFFIFVQAVHKMDFSIYFKYMLVFLFGIFIKDIIKLCEILLKTIFDGSILYKSLKWIVKGLSTIFYLAIFLYMGLALRYIWVFYTVPRVNHKEAEIDNIIWGIKLSPDEYEALLMAGGFGITVLGTLIAFRGMRKENFEWLDNKIRGSAHTEK